ncbi:MAG TPA: efflux RND transporter periplasmic adaptor subunit [Polyangiaceae bacterium]|nr:efflux RND transporter periplasmic adaptor subunit [Polyangiaceae bacterium]
MARLLLLLASTAGSVGCSAKASPAVVAAAPENTVLLTASQLEHMKIATDVVDLRDVDDTVVASGKVTYDDQKVSHVFSPVAGKIGRVYAQLGSHVKKGDPLVTLESPDIGAATSDVRKAEADLTAADNEYKRQTELFDMHATSQREFEGAVSSYGQAKAESERAHQKAALFQHGDVIGQTFTVRSDIDGEVFMKAVSPGMQIAGQYSGSAAELFTIGEADRVWVLADIFELDIQRVKVGEKVAVNVASIPERTFEGSVDWVSSALDPTTHASRARCTFDNRDGALKPEMFATVSISVDAKQAVAIPRSAVLRLGDQTVAFLDRGRDKDGRERFERAPVIVDEGVGSKWVPVAHGLDRGDRVVTSGAILLSGTL